MHCASICQGGTADDSGKYQRADHLSAPDLDGDSQNFWLWLPCLFPATKSTDPRLPSGDIIGHGVRKVANALDRGDPLHGGCYLSHQ